MSSSLYRTNSASGINRIGSSAAGCSSSRAGSAGPENRALREQITRLQKDLLLSKAETQKVTDQLNCLISLIKRTWTGDQTANVHVANIVGMAPPDIVYNGISSANNISVSAKPKTRAVNNWAVLTIGLLNREYRRMEKELEVKQRCYLQERQLYLEEQLMQNRDQILRFCSNAHPSPTRNGSAHTQNGRSQHLLAGNSKSEPTGRHCTSPVEGVIVHGHQEMGQGHTYGRQQLSIPERISVNRPPSAIHQRRPSAKSRRAAPQQETEVNLTWADLVIEPGHGKSNKTTNMVMDGLYRLPSHQAELSAQAETELANEEFDEDRLYLTYDDPHRYAQNGLFNIDDTVAPDSFIRKKRPLSGQLKQADSLRARPKSAVVKHERPLKYETTRPISAKTSAKTKEENSKSTKRPPHSAKGRQFVTMTDSQHNRPIDQKDDQCESKPGQGQHHQVQSMQGQGKYGPTRTGQGDEPEEGHPDGPNIPLEDPQLASLMNIDVSRPQCIEEFDEELRQMAAKERDFKHRAVELQKRLGISPGGILYPDL